MELAVHVGDTDLIEIDHSEVSHAGPDEGFDSPRSNAADANDSDARVEKAVERRLTVKPGDAAKTMGK